MREDQSFNLKAMASNLKNVFIKKVRNTYGAADIVPINVRLSKDYMLLLFPHIQLLLVDIDYTKMLQFLVLHSNVRLLKEILFNTLA